MLALAASNASATPAFSRLPSSLPSPAFAGGDIAFTALARDSAGDSLVYSWNFGDGSSTPYAPDPSATHRFAEPGRYAVIVRARAPSGQASASFLQAVHLRPAATKPTASATLLLDGARRRVWTVNPDNHSVACLDADKLTLIFEKPVGRNPRTVAQAAGGPVWVANQGDATLSVLDPATGAPLRTVPMPFASQPFGLAFSPDGKRLYVTLQATGRLLRIDPSGFDIEASLDAGPQPRHLAVSPDGRVWVGRFISPADSGEVGEVDAGFRSRRAVALAYDPSGDTETGGGGVPNYLGAMAVHPSGHRLYVPSKKDNTRKGLTLDGRRLDFESTVRTVLSQVDISAGAGAAAAEDLAARFDFDNSDLASAIVFSPLGDLAFVALQGTGRVDVRDPYNAMSSLLRLPETGIAPQGLLLDSAGGRLFVQNFMSRTVVAYDVSTVLANVKYAAPRLADIPTVIEERLAPEVLKGKRMFYHAADPRMSKDGYLACATCHLDGNSDRRVWDFTDRGEGLRRTTSLLGRAGTGHGPVHWSANFDEIQDFEQDMRGPMGGLGFLDSAAFLAGTRHQALGDRKAGLSPDLDALAAYVASLREAPASPYRNPDGTFTADGEAGRALFHREDVGCARCHAGTQFTDSRLPAPGTAPRPAGPGDRPGDWITEQGFLLHDVGTLKPASGKRLADTLRGLDTPTLLGVWEGGPYLHDGSAATLRDVITTANPDDRHGKTSHLSDREKDQLVEFLRQLGGDGVVAGGGIETGNTGMTRASILGGRPLPGRGWRIAWTLPGPEDGWELDIKDLAGRSVRAAAARGGPRAAGGSWDWDGLDAGGSRAPPGVYVVRLRVGPRLLTARFIAGR